MNSWMNNMVTGLYCGAAGEMAMRQCDCGCLYSERASLKMNSWNGFGDQAKVV
jgi:hypothetical protein